MSMDEVRPSLETRENPENSENSGNPGSLRNREKGEASKKGEARHAAESREPTARDRAEADRQRQMRHALHNAAQSEGVLRSSLASEANRARNHMMAAETEPHDPVELWAKRTGRLISLIFVLGLVVYLFVL